MLTQTTLTRGIRVNVSGAATQTTLNQRNSDPGFPSEGDGR